MNHYHCPGTRCYWRIQFTDTCSRCGGATITRKGCCTLSHQEEVTE